MKKLLTLVFFAAAINTLAQHEADNWYFGNNAGITFATNPPTFLPGSAMIQYEGCASISDAGGTLLFYSDGITVYDRSNTQMPNGSGLLGGYSSTQSCLIVPQPGSPLFYVFTTTAQEDTIFKLSYSIVDMTLNGGYGDVTVKNTLMLYPSTEKLTAVKHNNGVDIWIIGHEFNSANFYAFLFSSAGINLSPVVSSVGLNHGSHNQNCIGYMKASPCGNKLVAAVYWDNFIELFDFDNATGIVSNSIQLANYSGTFTHGFYGVEFSPDESRIYASTTVPANIIQWNLLAGNPVAIIASATTIGMSPVIYNGALQTGPDGRIYVAKSSDSTLACISYPNILGIGCSYIENYISLNPYTTDGGLPNFLTSYFCGLNVNTTNPATTSTIKTIYPNPAKETLHISLNANTTGSTSISIVSTLGEQLLESSKTFEKLNTKITIPLTNFSKGVYFLKVQLKDGVEVRKFVVE